MTLGPSCISFWGLIILAGALLFCLCGPFHGHTKNTTAKKCREEGWRWPESKWRSLIWLVRHQKKRTFVERGRLSEEEQQLFRCLARGGESDSVVVMGTKKEKGLETLTWGLCEWKHDKAIVKPSFICRLQMNCFCFLSRSFRTNCWWDVVA